MQERTLGKNLKVLRSNYLQIAPFFLENILTKCQYNYIIMVMKMT